MDSVEKRVVESLYASLVHFFGDGSGSCCDCCGYIMAERGVKDAKHLLGCQLALLYEMAGGQVKYLLRDNQRRGLAGRTIV